jgi:hypothetical protein
MFSEVSNKLILYKKKGYINEFFIVVLSRPHYLATNTFYRDWLRDQNFIFKKNLKIYFFTVNIILRL